MDNGLNEALSLYRASVRQAPALMMEGIPVDSNRGVTARGNSPYDKFASPDTRAKVLESRLQEIEAFARSRSIPTSNIYAAAESAMRTGKIPDLGQFGLAGDDAVACKQFLISNVLNIAGLEWTDYKGDSVVEIEEEGDAQEDEEQPLDPHDPLAFMSESNIEGYRRGTQAHTGEHGRGLGWRVGSGRINKVQLKVGKTKRRREGRADAEAGRTDYEAERQQDDIDVDDVMAEAFSSRRQRSKQARQQAQRTTRRDDAEKHPDEVEIFKSITRKDPREYMRHGASQREGERTHARTNKYGDDLPVRGIMRSYEDPSGMPTTKHRDNVSKGASKLQGMRSQQDDIDVDTALYVGEEGGPYRTGGAPEAAPVSPVRQSPGADGPVNPMSYMKYDLLSKPVMAKLKSVMGDSVYNYGREDLRRLAQERGLLGTDEAIEESLTEANAEQALKTRRAAQQHARETERSAQASAKEKQIARALAQGQKNLATSAAGEGRRWQNQQALSTALAGASQTSRPRQQIDVQRAERQGGWQGAVAGQQQRANQASQALGLDKQDVGGGAKQYMRQRSHQESVVALSSLIEEAVEGGNSAGISPLPGPTKSPWEDDEEEAARRKQEDAARTEVEKILGIYSDDPRSESWPKMGPQMASLMGLSEGAFQDVIEADRRLQRKKNMTQEEIEAEEKALRERSESDKILGIMPGDPRAEAWPKVSDEMKSLMNLEDHGVFRTRRSPTLAPVEKPLEEATMAGGMGGFIGAGLGGGLSIRTPAKPSYDDSYELPEDPQARVDALKKLLSKHGLREEGRSVENDVDTRSESQERIREGQESPVFRSGDYNTHPSRWMKQR